MNLNLHQLSCQTVTAVEVGEQNASDTGHNDLG